MAVANPWTTRTDMTGPDRLRWCREEGMAAIARNRGSCGKRLFNSGISLTAGGEALMTGPIARD